MYRIESQYEAQIKCTNRNVEITTLFHRKMDGIRDEHIQNWLCIDNAVETLHKLSTMGRCGRIQSEQRVHEESKLPEKSQKQRGGAYPFDVNS